MKLVNQIRGRIREWWCEWVQPSSPIREADQQAMLKMIAEYEEFLKRETPEERAQREFFEKIP